MKVVGRFALMACLAVIAPVLLAAAEPAKVAGAWSFTVKFALGTGTPTVTITQDGEKISGTYDGRYGRSPLKGTVKDKAIEFTVSMTAEGTAVNGVFKGVVEGESMSGSMVFDQAGEGTWTAVKKAPSK